MCLGLVLLVAAATISCSVDVLETDNAVILVIRSMSQASNPFGDMLTSGGTIPEDTVDVIFVAFLKNPDQSVGQVQPELQSIALERYEVSFVRTDGGTATPRGFTRGLSGVVRLLEQGIEEIEQVTTVNGLVVVPSTQKAQPPLSYLIDPGFEPDTGFINIQCDLVITFFGKTLSGDSVQVTGRIGINFADFGDTNP